MSCKEYTRIRLANSKREHASMIHVVRQRTRRVDMDEWRD